jgi:NAD(P)-dependent dehydrogenase (short-subunit alcohol dehydrogenase family)
VARRFAADGLHVVVTDIDDDAGEEVAASLGDAVEYQHLDVRSEKDWEDVVGGVVEQYGRLDVVVNNAGVTGFEEGLVPHDPEHAELASWRGVHETNLDGTFLGCRAAIRAMRPAGQGAIVNVSSRSGLSGVPGAAAYASSKAAIRNHTKSVALYCAEQGLRIRCNAVFPGAILTRIWEPMLGDGPDREDRLRALSADVPVQRMGTPAEVAAAVAYLASEEAGYTTGSELVIDGGLTAGTTARPDR